MDRAPTRQARLLLQCPTILTDSSVYDWSTERPRQHVNIFLLLADCADPRATCPSDNQFCGGHVSDGGGCSTNTGKAHFSGLYLSSCSLSQLWTSQQSSVLLADCIYTTSTCTSGVCTGKGTVADKGACTASTGKSLCLIAALH